jgi:hypothetical protein
VKTIDVMWVARFAFDAAKRRARGCVDVGLGIQPVYIKTMRDATALYHSVRNGGSR